MNALFLSMRVRMSWNIGYNRNLFLELKSKLELYHDVLTTSKSSPKKPLLTIIDIKQLLNVQQVDSWEGIFFLHNGKRKVYVSFLTDTDKLNIVLYRYRNKLYLKDSEDDLKLS